VQEAHRNWKPAKGQVSQQTPRRRAGWAKVRLAADADYFKAQREAR